MEEPAVQMVEVEGDCRKEEGKEVLPAGEGMEPVEVFFCIIWLLGNSWGHMCTQLHAGWIVICLRETFREKT